MGRPISLADAIHAVIVSATFAIASSGVAPSLMQPGRSGTATAKPLPSSSDSGSTMTEYSRRVAGIHNLIDERYELFDAAVDPMLPTDGLYIPDRPVS